jgi:hypothetical protein
MTTTLRTKCRAADARRRLFEPVRKFSDYVERRGPDECWLWTGTLSSEGYGKFGHEYAHRIALQLSTGRLLEKGEHACHRCDVRSCVNPAHLFAGTATDNNRDMIAKGRHKRFREWSCPGCGDAVAGVVKASGGRCPSCRSLATKAKRRRAYVASRLRPGPCNRADPMQMRETA